MTSNDVAGLVVNGTAAVSIIDSSFVNNRRAVWDGGALVVGGNATVHLAATVFADNQVRTTSRTGGEWLLHARAGEMEQKRR